MTGFIFALPSCRADSAGSSAIGEYVGVRGVVRVSLRTSHFKSIERGCIRTSQSVNSCRHNFKVIGVDTPFDATEMIELQALRNRAINLLIKPAVSENTAVANCESWIACRVDVSKPKVASIGAARINLEPEPLDGSAENVECATHREPRLSGVTGRAVCAAPSFYFTPFGLYPDDWLGLNAVLARPA